MRIRLDISYDGSRYLGWQKQNSTEFSTVQQELERAIFRLCQQKVATTASGRTDRGVHAELQVVHFDFSGTASKYNWIRGLNSILPDDISVLEAYEVPKDFHALHSAADKTYKYDIYYSEARKPLKRYFQSHSFEELNLENLQNLAEVFLGEQDFKSLQNTGTEVATTIRHINSSKWEKTSENTYTYTVTGNGFLKQMVRNMVGIMLELQWKNPQISHQLLKEILAAKDRTKAGPVAPPQGLRLFHISYPVELDRECRKL